MGNIIDRDLLWRSDPYSEHVNFLKASYDSIIDRRNNWLRNEIIFCDCALIALQHMAACLWLEEGSRPPELLSGEVPATCDSKCRLRQMGLSCPTVSPIDYRLPPPHTNGRRRIACSCCHWNFTGMRFPPVPHFSSRGSHDENMAAGMRKLYPHGKLLTEVLDGWIDRPREGRHLIAPEYAPPIYHCGNNLEVLFADLVSVTKSRNGRDNIIRKLSDDKFHRVHPLLNSPQRSRNTPSEVQLSLIHI